MTGFVDLMNDIAAAWAPSIWKASWQGGVALLLVLIASRCLRDGSASLKCWLWRLAFCKLLIAALWFGPIPLRWLPPENVAVPAPLAMSEAAAATKVSATRFDGEETGPPIVSPTGSPNVGSQATSLTVESLDPIAWLLLAWFVGVAFGTARFARHWICLRRMLARCTPLVSGPAVDCLVECSGQFRIRRRPRLLTCNELVAPFLTGIHRPAIVLPAAFANGSSCDELRVALSHELAHIKRKDLCWDWLIAIAERLFFFHPFVWWARREWCVAREIAADECAIRESRMNAATYGRSLLELVARFPARERSVCLTIGVSEAYSQLSRRMIAMKTFQKNSARRFPGLAMLLVAIAVLGLMPWTLAAREAVVATKPDEAKENRSAADRGDDDQDGPSQTVHGVVRDESGEPVSGATVLAGYIPMRSWPWQIPKPYDPQRQVQTTDDEGRFELSVIHNARLLIVVYKDGMSLASHLAQGSEPGSDPLLLSLSETGPLVGRVNNSDGDPISGARARIETMTTTAYPKSFDWNYLIKPIISGTELESLVTATTDKNGEFRFEAFGPQAMLKISAEGMATRRTIFDQPRKEISHEGSNENPIILTLQPEGIIEGRVVTELGGVDVGGLTVRVQASRRSAFHADSWSQKTDAQGRFRFDALSAGTANVFLTNHPADGPWTYRAARDVRVKPGGRAEVVIKLVKGYLVKGKVVDPDGHPVAGVHVGVYAPIRPPGGGAANLNYETKEDGIYRFHLPRGTAQIYMSGAPAGYELRSEERFFVRVGQGRIEGPKLTIKPKSKDDARRSRGSVKIQSSDDESGRSIVIHVVDEKGEPIKGAEVFRNHVYRPKGRDKPEIENEHYRTDANGTAVVSLSGASVDLRLWVSKKDFVTLHAMWAKQFQADGDQIPKEFTFQLQAGTEIGGVVRDRIGRPIEGVKVEVIDRTAESFAVLLADKPPGIRPVRDYWLAYGDDAVLTDAQGRWTLGNVPPDEAMKFNPRIDPGMFISGWSAPAEEEIRQVKAQKLKVYFSHPDYASDEVREGENDIQRSQNITLEELRAGTAVAVMTQINGSKRAEE